MKTRTFALLVLLNVVLIWSGFYFFSDKTPSPAPAETLQLREYTKSSPSKVAKKEMPLPQKLVYVTNQFNWNQIESSDYRKYIENLRTVGCPEATIKDIILTDIMKLYAARRGQFFHNGREFKFWETDEKRKLNARQLEEREKQLASIDKEIPAVLRDLLGINYEREINKYFVETNEEDRRLSFLPVEKRDQILALREQFEGMRERVLENANGNISSTDAEVLRKIERQRNEELGKILSGSELAEFELRMSPVADQLRDKLIGFNPSEAEFRQIFELEKAVEEKFAFANSTEKAAAQAEIQNELKRELGDARYAEYQRAQNPDFRDARLFTEVYELPVSTAQTIFDIKQIAETERQNLLKNSSVSEPQLLEALKAIQTETEKNLRQTMGTKVYASYSQGTGSWIKKLGSEK